MHKTEARRFNLAFVVEDDIKGVLLTANTVLLATLARDFNLRKGSQLVIKRQFPSGFGSTRCLLLTVGQEILEWRDPGVDWTKDGIVQGGQLGIDQLHLLKVCLILIVNVVEDDIAGWAGIAVQL